MYNFQSLYNFRDLGGITARNGLCLRKQMIYRSNALSNVSSIEQWQLQEVYGVRTVIDLRSERERISKPDMLPKGVIYLPLTPNSLNIEVSDRLNGNQRMSTVEKLRANIVEPYLNMEEKMKNIMRSFVSDYNNRNIFAKMLKACLSGEVSILIHCTTGKDRVGFGCAVLLAALDIPREDIYKDYLLTNVMIKAEYERKMSEFRSIVKDSILLNNLKSMLVVSEQYLDAAMDEIENRYGCMQGFLTEGLNFDLESQKLLQKRYLKHK